MLTEEEMVDWQAGLDALHARIGRHFRRADARARAKRYLSGLLERVERKNGWQLAERLGETGPQGVQRLLNAAEWDVEAVRDDLRDYVVEQLGEEEVALTEYRDFADAYAQIGRFLDDVYQRKRIHSALGYLTPAEFEAAYHVHLPVSVVLP